MLLSIRTRYYLWTVALLLVAAPIVWWADILHESEYISHYEVSFNGSTEDWGPGFYALHVHVEREDATVQVPFLVEALDTALREGWASFQTSEQDEAAEAYLSNLTAPGNDWRDVEFEGNYFDLGQSVT